MVQASIEAGIPANPEFNGNGQEVSGFYQTTTKNRRPLEFPRAYSARAQPSEL